MEYLLKTAAETTSQITIVPCAKNDKNRLYTEVISNEIFVGNAGEHLYASVPNGKTQSQIMLIGLGDTKKRTALSYCTQLADAVRFLQDKKQSSVAIALGADFFELGAPRELGELLARMIGLTTYYFVEYITDTERHVSEMSSIICVGVPRTAQRAFAEGLSVGRLIDEAVGVTRTLGNHTPGNMHPEEFGRATIRAAKGVAKLTVKVLSKKEIAAEKMGGLLGVSAGSVRPPTFIIMEYRGGKSTDAPTVFVGKGITFDAGGISIKPSSKMDEMKFDMLGGATVIGAVLAAAKLKLSVNVIGLVPAAENLPSGSAIVPSEILRMHSGKTVEVLDTDAEGRLILADALSYAKKYHPKFIVDVATLTGACVVALGETRAGFWSTDEKLATRMSAASEKTGELVWRMPLGEDYSSQTKSDVADLKNITERWGSANTAAAFLQEFVDGPWAHLDIAGVGNSQKLRPARRHGASGWGVALLLELLRR